MIDRRSFIAGSLGLASALPLMGCSMALSKEADDTAFSKGSTTTAAGDESLDYAAHLNKDAIMTVDIIVSADSWQTMLDNARNEEYIEVDITINGWQLGCEPWV